MLPSQACSGHIVPHDAKNAHNKDGWTLLSQQCLTSLAIPLHRLHSSTPFAQIIQLQCKKDWLFLLGLLIIWFISHLCPCERKVGNRYASPCFCRPYSRLIFTPKGAQTMGSALRQHINPGQARTYINPPYTHWPAATTCNAVCLWNAAWCQQCEGASGRWHAKGREVQRSEAELERTGLQNQAGHSLRAEQ